MSLTLTIGGSNFLPQYKTGSAKITERLGNKINKLELTIIKKSGDSLPQEGQEIIFKDDTRYLFGGYITKLEPIEIGEGEMFIYEVEAGSYEVLLVNKFAQITYSDKTLAYIINDLLTNYVDSGYSITQNNVQTGPTIDSIAFNHVSLRKAFEKLSKLTGYEWHIDYEKDLHFHSPEYEPAQEQITDASNNHSNIAISVDTSQVRNSIIVRGGVEEVDSYFAQDIECDGVAREWILREKPTTVEHIKLNTVSKAFGEDPDDEETGNDFMYNSAEKFIREVSGSLTSNGDTIEISYKYEVPVIVKLKSATSIAAMKAIEGGDGIHDFMVVETNIKSKAEARARALRELEQYADPLLTGIFITNSELLAAGTIFAPGQRLTVNLPTWNINSDTEYLIQEVIIKPIENATDIVYNYKVKFGGRLTGIREFLENLAGKEEYIFGSKEIDRIEAIAEVIGAAETITRDGNAQSVSENIGAEESVSKSNTTPPFKWMPSGTKPAKWGKFEWG